MVEGCLSPEDERLSYVVLCFLLVVDFNVKSFWEARCETYVAVPDVSSSLRGVLQNCHGCRSIIFRRYGVGLVRFVVFGPQRSGWIDTVLSLVFVSDFSFGKVCSCG